VEEPDGRRRRSRDSRSRIIAAMIELVRGGDITPSAADVACRAGVGLRSVFRHFNDMESLYREMTDLIESDLRARAALPFKGETWRARIIEMVDRRGAGFEAVAPMIRAASALRHTSAVLRDDHTRMVAALRALLRQQAPRGALDRPRLQALELLLSFESWNRLREDQGLTVAETRKVLRTAIEALIGGD
jgi:AcrR family transcriptional regulator